MNKISLVKKISILVLTLSLFGLANYNPIQTKAFVSVTASHETNPVLNPPDAADDLAVWIHPTDTSLSTIIATDKPGGLEVYDLLGNVLQRIPFKTNNVDIRYNFLLNGERVALVTGMNRTTFRMFVYKVNPQTRLLEDVAAVTSTSMSGLQGSAMYVSPVSGKYYSFMNFNGVLKQYELTDNGQGKVSVTLVRTSIFNSSGALSEGVVADDVRASVYISDEAVGIWKLGAEPTDGDTKELIDGPIASGGNIQPDVEGLTIYYKTDGTGYLIASSQGNGTFTVYTRENGNDFLGSFKIVDGTIDKVTGTDGIDVINFPLGSSFPNGIFIAQDGSNINNGLVANQNFKLVPLENISTVLNLTLDTTWDPRLVGLQQNPTPSPTPTSVPTSTPTFEPTPTSTSTAEPTPTIVPTATPTAEPTPTFEPTVTPSPTPSPTLPPVPQTLVFTPSDDAYISAAVPTKNFGNVTTLQVDGSPVKYIFMKFNISGLNGAAVQDAKIRIYNTEPSILGGSLRQITDNSWSQSTIKYNNAPIATGLVISSVARTLTNNWYEFNVTSLVSGDGQLSVRIESNNANGASYNSKEGNSLFIPQLVITSTL